MSSSRFSCLQITLIFLIVTPIFIIIIEQINYVHDQDSLRKTVRRRVGQKEVPKFPIKSDDPETKPEPEIIVEIEPTKETKKNKDFSIKYLQPVPKKLSTNEGHTLPYCYEKIQEKMDSSIKITNDQQTMRQIITDEMLEKELSELDPYSENPIVDGCWSPDAKTDCIPDQHINIIVPYRNREKHMKFFLWVFHPFLQKMKRSYCIIFIEQSDLGQFNRGKLLNAGYLEIKKNHRYWKSKNIIPDCNAFHDIDMMPDDSNNIYMCDPIKAIHIVDKYNKYAYKTQYAAGRHISTGAAMLMSSLQYEFVNGHPNFFWGWGVEDIDMSARIRDSPTNVTKELVEQVFGDEEKRKNLPIGALRNNYFQEGLTEDGGGPGLVRQDIYGRYTQLHHIYGFTNGPIRVKTTNEQEINLGKWNVGHYKDERNKGWDGLSKTNYKVNDFEYNRYYSKINVEIRPAETTKLVMKTGESDKTHLEINLLNYQKNNTKDCQFIKLQNVISNSTNVPKSEIEVQHDSPFKNKLKVGLHNCYETNNKHGQCNSFSMNDFWLPKTYPYPLISKPAEYKIDNCEKHGGEPGGGENCYDSFIKHCPGILGWFQVVEEDIILPPNKINTKNNEIMPVDNFKYLLDFEIDLIDKNFIGGGLFYEDHLIFEGVRHSGRFLHLEVIPGTFKNETDGLTVDTSQNGSKLSVSVTINFNNFIPGVAFFNHRIIDYFGQIYFDANLIFKVVGAYENEKSVQNFINTKKLHPDEYLRTKFLPQIVRKETDEWTSEEIAEVRKDVEKRIRKFYEKQKI